MALLAVFLLVLVTGTRTASAVGQEASSQCPAGGNVGDPCKDNTNGFMTTGHCVYIGWCKADNYKQPPPSTTPETSSPSGSVSNPTGNQNPFNVTVHPGDPGYLYEPQQDGGVDGAQEWTVTQVVQAAYEQAQSFVPDSSSAGEGDNYLKYLDFNGTQYLVTPDAILEIGTPLGQKGTAPSIPKNFDTTAFRSIASISPEAPSQYQPPQNAGLGAQKNIEDTETFVGVAGNAGSRVLTAQQIQNVRNILMKSSLSDVAIALGVLAILLGLPLFFLYKALTKRSEAMTEASKMDSTVMAKNLATKDVSVATPVDSDKQEKVIWDNQQHT